MAYTGWALLELMGHRSRVGKVSEVTMYGAALLQIEIPVFADDGTMSEFVTELYGGSSIYGLTPVSDDVGEAMAKRRGDPRPVRPTDFRLSPPVKPAFEATYAPDDENDENDQSDEDDDFRVEPAPPSPLDTDDEILF